MNTELKYNYGYSRRTKEIEENFVAPVIDEKEVMEVSTSKDSFLKIVYAPDPVSKLPTGDLSYLVSDKANPEVKQWILDNLMIDVSSAALPAAPHGLSDDDVIALSRDPREDVHTYMDRVNKYAKDNQQLYERMVASARESMGTRQDVSSKPEETPVSNE